MPFGLPVVPEENITHSGCAKGTATMSSGTTKPVAPTPPDAMASTHGTVPPAASSVSPSRGTTTVALRLGIEPRMVASSARRSIRLPA